MAPSKSSSIYTIPPIHGDTGMQPTGVDMVIQSLGYSQSPPSQSPVPSDVPDITALYLVV